MNLENIKEQFRERPWLWAVLAAVVLLIGYFISRLFFGSSGVGVGGNVGVSPAQNTKDNTELQTVFMEGLKDIKTENTAGMVAIGQHTSELISALNTSNKDMMKGVIDNQNSMFNSLLSAVKQNEYYQPSVVNANKQLTGSLGGNTNTGNKATGLTSYTQGVKDSISASPTVATYGRPVAGTYQGKTGTWNNFGEFKAN